MAATTDLISVLPVSEARFLLDYLQVSGLQGSGQPRGIDLGEPLWTARITCSVVTDDQQRDAEAYADMLDGVVGEFLVWNPRRQYPKSDPDGTILGSSTVTINTIAGDRKSLSFAGLPAGYVLSRSDFFSAVHGVAPDDHWCLHRLVGTGTANGSGVTGSIEVRPRIRAGLSAGATVTLKRPTMKAFIPPGAFDSHNPRGRFGVIAVEARQVP